MSRWKTFNKMSRKFWLENVKGPAHSEDLGIDGIIILEWILGAYVGRMWTGCICLKTGTSGGLLWTR